MNETKIKPIKGGAKRAKKVRSYQSEGRLEQKRETRSRILACALTHFSERGFDSASLRDIATDAGVTHSLVRSHFGSKGALWRAAIDQLYEHQAAALDLGHWVELERLTVEEMREAIHRFVRYSAAYPEAIRINLQEAITHDSERVAWLVDKHIKRIEAPFTRLFRQAMVDGLVVEMPMHTFVYTFTSLGMMMFALRSEVRRRFDVNVLDPEVIEAHAESMCRLLIRDYAGPNLRGRSPRRSKRAQ